MTSRRSARAAAVAVLVAVPLGVAGPAAGSEATVGPTALAGPSPYAACEPGTPTETVERNVELEPWLAVDRSDPRRMVAVWQQDRLARGNAFGIVLSVTSNGGATWRNAPAEGLSRCSGGAQDRTGSPWVSFGPGGVVHLSAASLGRPGTSEVLVSRSPDAGASWAPPVSVANDSSAEYWNDKPSVTADPRDPRYVYVTWNRGHIPLSRHQVVVARSVDGGRTYEAPRAVYQPAPDGAGTFGSQIVVLRDGTLLHLFVEKVFSLGIPPPVVQSKVRVMRSTDRGVTWTAPTTVVEQTINQPVLPDTGAIVPAPGINPDVAVDPKTGAIYVVWGQTGLSPADGDVALSASLDGGRHWTPPVRVNRTPATTPAANGQAFLPQVDVADDGTVGVSYYDFRTNTPAAGTPTDLWLATCRGPLCAFRGDWQERHLAGPFDIETALPWQGGPYIGSYVSLGHTRQSFVAAYTATTGDPANRQDVFVASLPVCADR